METLLEEELPCLGSSFRALGVPTFLTGLAQSVAIVMQSSPHGLSEFYLKRSHPCRFLGG